MYRISDQHRLFRLRFTILDDLVNGLSGYSLSGAIHQTSYICRNNTECPRSIALFSIFIVYSRWEMDKTSWTHEEKSKNCTSPLYTCVCLKCIKALKKHTYQSYLVYPRRDGLHSIICLHIFVIILFPSVLNLVWSKSLVLYNFKYFNMQCSWYTYAQNM